MTCIGYGEQAANGRSLPYWHVQNSWGSNWGDSGFVKFLRGEDLAGIEDVALYFHSWPEGSSAPDISSSGGTSSDSNSALLGRIIDLIKANKKAVEMVVGGLLFAFACVFVRCCCAGGSSGYAGRREGPNGGGSDGGEGSEGGEGNGGCCSCCSCCSCCGCQSCCCWCCPSSESPGYDRVKEGEGEPCQQPEDAGELDKQQPPKQEVEMQGVSEVEQQAAAPIAAEP